MTLRPWSLLILVVGCADKDTDDSAAAVPFSQVDAELLVPSCGFSGCHGSGTGGLELDGEGDHAALVNVPSVGAPEQVLVVPGDADASYLVLKLEGRAGIVGEVMPPSGSLDAERIGQVRAWIDGGALE